MSILSALRSRRLQVMSCSEDSHSNDMLLFRVDNVRVLCTTTLYTYFQTIIIAERLQLLQIKNRSVLFEQGI